MGVGRGEQLQGRLWASQTDPVTALESSVKSGCGLSLLVKNRNYTVTRTFGFRLISLRIWPTRSFARTTCPESESGAPMPFGSEHWNYSLTPSTYALKPFSLPDNKRETAKIINLLEIAGKPSISHKMYYIYEERLRLENMGFQVNKGFYASHILCLTCPKCLEEYLVERMNPNTFSRTDKLQGRKQSNTVGQVVMWGKHIQTYMHARTHTYEGRLLVSIYRILSQSFRGPEAIEATCRRCDAVGLNLKTMVRK